MKELKEITGSLNNSKDGLNASLNSLGDFIKNPNINVKPEEMVDAVKGIAMLNNILPKINKARTTGDLKEVFEELPKIKL